MLHHRSDKNSHLDTVLYEIDMLRHCSNKLAAKKAKKSESEEAEPEYNLGIEGFLIHLRNLLAFLTTLHSRNTDLRFDRPEVWLGRPLAEKEYSDLRDKAQAFNDSYSETFNGGKKVDCHDLISKFLQHCTPERYEQAIVGWEIEKMLEELKPILAEFEKRFTVPVSPKVRVWTSPESSHSTATIRRFGVTLASEEEEQEGPTAVPAYSRMLLHKLCR